MCMTAVATDGACEGSFSASTTSAYSAFRQLDPHKLLEDGSLRSDGPMAAFTRDVVFSSRSTASAIVTGRSCNRRIVWVTEAGLTFRRRGRGQGLDDTQTTDSL